MPTAYTADIEYREFSLKEFVTRCSKAFIYSQTDEPIDAPIPDMVENRGSSGYSGGVGKGEY